MYLAKFLILQIWLELSFIFWTTKTMTQNLDSTIAVFDPYVSILDKDYPFRYNEIDLLPFVAKAATRFSKLLVWLTEIDVVNNLETSKARCLLAIAKYNHLQPQNGTIIEAWLSYSSEDPESIYEDAFAYHQQPIPLKQALLTLAEKANFVHANTVTTVLLPANLIRRLPNVTNVLSDASLSVTYNLGVLIDSLACEYFPGYITNVITEINPQLVVFELRFKSFTKGLSLNTAVDRFYITLQQCKMHFDETIVRMGIVGTIPDTVDYESTNMARLVRAWHKLNDWSLNNNVVLILSKTFDTPCEQKIYGKTNGWWRLKENFAYNSTTQYIFEEKSEIAEIFDKIENPRNYTWLHSTNIKFDKRHAGVIFSIYNYQDQTTEYPEKAMIVLRQYLIKKFTTFVLIFQDDGTLSNKVILYDIQNIAKLKATTKQNTEVLLMVMPQVEIRNVFKNIKDFSLARAAVLLNVDKYLVNTYILPYNENNTFELANFTRNVLLFGLDPTRYKIGYAFNVSICSSRKHFDTEVMQEVISDAEKIVIYFEEDDITLKLGASRMIEQRIVLLEHCQSLFRRTTKVEVIFVLLHFFTDAKFYTSPWRLQNFIRYTDMLANWALDTNVTVIFSNAIDGARNLKTRNEIVTELGWWRFQQSSSITNTPSIRDDARWVEKRIDALLISDRYFPKPNVESSLTTEYIILIVLVPLFFSGAVIVLAIYITRNYYRDTFLTKSEIDEFFNGSQYSDQVENEYIAHQMAYNKKAYEIDEKAFTIDEGKALGCGEFGKVCKGKLEKDGIHCDVAIKTVNPHKIHKTMLSGLLSEIKILSYIGKHINIIELIGATTSNLKDGKVFVILELCQLGSLKSHLEKLRPTTLGIPDGVQSKKRLSLLASSRNRGNMEYTNLMALKTIVLDSELSKDLYQWAKQICNGMAYLASKHVVHADLATRNVLLNLNKDAKICDFGLSRRMYNYTNYQKEKQEPLPWKWMSPEALRLLQFSEKSDIWAFGVTLWEIYSLGDVPYPGLSWDLNFPYMLENGFRLNEPLYNDRNMYSIMKECWNSLPSQRPTFKDLWDLLE